VSDTISRVAGKIIEFIPGVSGKQIAQVPPLEERANLRFFANGLNAPISQSLIETRLEFERQRRMASDAHHKISEIMERSTSKATAEDLSPLIGKDGAKLLELRRLRDMRPQPVTIARVRVGIKEIHNQLAASVREQADPAAWLAKFGSTSPAHDVGKLEALLSAQDKTVSFHAGCLHLVKQFSVVEAIVHEFSHGRSALSLDECRTVMTAVVETDDPEKLDAIRLSVVDGDTFDRFEASTMNDRDISPSI
jgi:hypothetical protein